MAIGFSECGDLDQTTGNEGKRREGVFSSRINRRQLAGSGPKQSIMYICFETIPMSPGRQLLLR